MKNVNALAWWNWQLTAAIDADARDRWQDKLDAIMKTAPSGSGFDNGTKLESISDKRIVFTTSFHHMNEHGYYDGWTDHQVIVTADLRADFDIRVTGRNKRQIKEYIADTFNQWLGENEPESVQ